jgi:hypothetical protein
LIDKIGLGSHATGKQEFQTHVRKCGFIMHHAHYSIASNSERRARTNGGGRR